MDVPQRIYEKTPFELDRIKIFRKLIDLVYSPAFLDLNLENRKATLENRKQKYIKFLGDIQSKILDNIINGDKDRFTLITLNLDFGNIGDSIAGLLSNYSVFCLQDVESYSTVTLKKIIENIEETGLRYYKYFYKSYDSKNPYNSKENYDPDKLLVIGYDKVIMGELENITPLSLFAYPIIVVLCSNLSLIIINVHMVPSNINKLNILNYYFRELEAHPRFRDHLTTYRIILTGEFNNPSCSLPPENLRVLGKTLVQHIDRSQTEERFVTDENTPTCCYPVFNKCGSYIFDSLLYDRSLFSSLNFLKTKNEDSWFYFGYPINYNRNDGIYPMYDPLVLLEMVHLERKQYRGVIKVDVDSEYKTKKKLEPPFLKIEFDYLDKNMLFDLALLYVKTTKLNWNIIKPLSWDKAGLPHISLSEDIDREHEGKSTIIKFKDIIHLSTLKNGRENDRWVMLRAEVKTYGSLDKDGLGRNKLDTKGDPIYLCKDKRECHMSIGQQKMQ